MPTRLEDHLSQLKAPAEPEHLKARCLATIPLSASSVPIITPAIRRPFAPRSVALLGALVMAIAFWSTRPGDEQTRMPLGSVAFAQTMQAFQSVSFGHVKGRDMEAGILRKGWHATDFFRSEIWFDADRGLYRERRSTPSNSQPVLAKGTSARALFLPDGLSYYRYADSNDLLVTSSPGHWESYKQAFTGLLSGKWTNRSQSPTSGQWKGQKAQFFQSEARSSAQDTRAMPGAIRMRTLLFVNPHTKLPLAFQQFAIYSDGIPRLTTEYEFDFGRPDAARFNPALLKKGALISHGREG